MRILVVEDERNARLVMQAYLSSLGHAVEGVQSGVEALEVVEDRRFKPDLLICDWMLRGEEDGVTVASRIARRHPEVGIVFVTGQAVEELRDASEELDVKDYLAKPFGLKELRQVVEQADHGRGAGA